MVKFASRDKSLPLLNGYLESASATPRDPVVLAAVVLAMAVLGLVANWIPARRALSVEPMILLPED